MLDGNGYDLLFREARSHKAWQDRIVGDDQLRQLYDLMKWGPTANNSLPLRVLFVRSPEAKAKLIPCMSEGNVSKVETAPVTAILGYDTRFFESWERFGSRDYATGYKDDPAKVEVIALRNSSLQGAYFIIAARAIGLDVCPMSGFDNAKVDEIFFGGTSTQSNFICGVGYGDPSALRPRGARYDFDEVCRIL